MCNGLTGTEAETCFTKEAGAFHLVIKGCTDGQVIGADGECAAPEVICSETQVKYEDKCVEKCAENEERNVSGACVAPLTCGADEEFNTEGTACIPKVVVPEVCAETQDKIEGVCKEKCA